MAFGTKVLFEPVREVAFGSVGASYSAVGSATLHHTRLVSFNNSTDQDIYISIDGVNNDLRIATNSFRLLDLTANEVKDEGNFISQNTVFYVKRAGGAPTLGNVWIEVMYSAGGV